MAAVSIQLSPRSTARRIVAIESASSCGPHPNRHSPPMAHAPRPIGVSSSVEFPRCVLETSSYEPVPCPRSGVSAVEISYYFMWKVSLPAYGFGNPRVSFGQPALRNPVVVAHRLVGIVDPVPLAAGRGLHGILADRAREVAESQSARRDTEVVSSAVWNLAPRAYTRNPKYAVATA